MSIDLGTGDGRLPAVLAREAPQRLFVGVDASAAGMRERSGRACRSHVPNLLFVRAAVEALPRELTGIADDVTVVLPWGSLLAAVVRPVPILLAAIRGLCQPHARLRVVVGVDPERDRRELRRLGVPLLDSASLAEALPVAYAEAGFGVTRLQRMGAAELASWPSTWAKRLAHGRPRTALQIEARAGGGPWTT